MISHREKLHFNFILTDIDVAGKKQVFEILAAGISEFSDVEQGVLYQAFMNQEEHSPSGIGEGVSLPHIQIAELQRPVSALIKIRKPMDYKVIDGIPVDVVCCVASPKSDGPHHLRRLSRLSRLLRNPAFCNDIRNLNNTEDLQNLFLESQTQMLMAA